MSSLKDILIDGVIVKCKTCKDTGKIKPVDAYGEIDYPEEDCPDCGDIRSMLGDLVFSAAEKKSSN
jgi:hypothetical protein